MKRIALLMSGDFRTFKLAFPGWYKNLYPYAKVDLFLSTWNRTSLFSDKHELLKHKNKFWDVDKEHVMDICKEYGVTPRYLNIEEPVDFFHRGNKQIYHWHRNITKLINCKDDYDFAILTRPDATLTSTNLANLLDYFNNDYIYSTQSLWINPTDLPYVVNIFDIFFMASPKNLIEVFLPVPYMTAKGEKINNKGLDNMHSHLAYYFVNNFINVQGIPGSNVYLYDHNILHQTTVVIPTAGKGTRLKELTSNFNKSLLPYKNKPILSYIIEAFPENTRFVIPVGYDRDKVIGFCQNMYPNRYIVFVDVDDYESEKSGPGYTLQKCEDHIQGPFWYVPCDTYFDDKLPDNLTEDTYFIKDIDSNLSSEYTTFKIKDDKIVDIKFKEQTNTKYKTFTGLMYINDYKKFLMKIENKNSKEVIDGISMNSDVRYLNSWEDMGNYDNYMRLFKKSMKYDFTKKDEHTYFVNNRVVKCFNDNSISKKKYDKAMIHPNVTPKNLQVTENWLSYEYVPGTTLYECKDMNLMIRLFAWLDTTVWIRQKFNLRKDATLFYKEKTHKRLEELVKKFESLPKISTVDGEKVKDIHYYLNNLDWKEMCENNVPSFIHGDLQFDNIIVDGQGQFTLIDWRHEFGTSVEVGDVYYDLAKLMAGLILDYSKVKKNDFNVTIDGNAATLKIPNVAGIEYHLSVLETCILTRGWSLEKTRWLVPLIFLNMAPLHEKPFDLFLYCMALKFFARVKNEKFL